MASKTHLIGTGTLTHDMLRDQVAIVTGAGRGIGFEAARALLWLGARVALAGIKTLAPLYGKTVEEFFAGSQEHIISPEAAGAGFADDGQWMAKSWPTHRPPPDRSRVHCL